MERVREKSPSSQDSNSLSLLTEISGVEAPVPLRSFSVLQSLASGLPRWRGEGGNKWGWWRRSWRELSGELSEGRREGSCCILGGGRYEKDETAVPDWSLFHCVSLPSRQILVFITDIFNRPYLFYQRPTESASQKVFLQQTEPITQVNSKF